MNDNQLIFMVSQPRAGSTMLQGILGRHPCIHTTTEPWLMLDPVQCCKRENITADHAAGGWSALARDSFVKATGNDDVIDEGLRHFGLHIYEQALVGTGKQMFLDKTPRYYGIFPELGRIFPDARFVILLRNPLSVLCSLIRTWIQEDWHRMPSYRYDLLKAPQDLMTGARALGDRVITLRYEDIFRADRSNPVRLELCDGRGFPE